MVHQFSGGDGEVVYENDIEIMRIFATNSVEKMRSVINSKGAENRT